MSAHDLTRSLLRWEAPLDVGLTLRGWRSRPSGKPVLHFTHGNGFCALAYTPFLVQLQSEFDLFLYDIQGHGDSDDGQRFLGWELNAQALDHAWHTHASLYGDVPSVGIGHSLGGVITLMRAARNPKIFSSLYLLDPILLSPKMILGTRLDEWFGVKSKLPMAEAARRRRNLWPNRANARRYLAKRGIFKSWHDDALDAYVDHALMYVGDQLKLKCPPRLEAAIFQSAPRRLWHCISKLQTPAHLLYGSDTFPFILDSVQRVQRKNPRIATKCVTGSHCFVQEMPKDIAEMVLTLAKGGQLAVSSSV